MNFAGGHNHNSTRYSSRVQVGDSPGESLWVKKFPHDPFPPPASREGPEENSDTDIGINGHILLREKTDQHDPQRELISFHSPFSAPVRLCMNLYECAHRPFGNSEGQGDLIG